jgi:ABC-type uncharacterized transport system substrate-binding protein
MKRAAVQSFLVAVVLLVVAVTAEAQQPTKIPRIGRLDGASPSDAGREEAFRQGLRELGYMEGKNVVIESRYAEGKFDRLPALAAELVRFKVDVIVTASPTDTRAAKDATATIPIVMPRIAILLATDLSPALRGPAATSRGCPECPPSWRENDWSF